MKIKKLGRTGLKVSELCLGCMTFGAVADQEMANRIVHRAMDAGINFLDTANIYGRGISEGITGKAIQDRRDRVVLATKVRWRMSDDPNAEGLSRYSILQQVEASLRRLGTDHIDLYQVHYWDDATPLEETLSTLNDLVRAGKVRYLGCSNFAAWQLARALWVSDVNGWARFDCLQPHYNLIDRSMEREHFPLCLDQGVGVINYSPLAGGILTGKYRPGEAPPAGSRGAQDSMFMQRRGSEPVLERAQGIAGVLKELDRPLVQSAIKWTLTHPAVTSPIIGVRNVEQLDLILNGWDDWELSPEEKTRLDDASAPSPYS